MCDLLQSMDNKIIQVALDGLENILKVGEIDKEAAGPGAVNQYAQFIEEAGGMVSIHNLQHHENLEIYKKCFYIMDSEYITRSRVSGSFADNLKSSSPTTTRRRRLVPLPPLTLRASTPSSRRSQHPRAASTLALKRVAHHASATPPCPSSFCLFPFSGSRRRSRASS
jgi:hypothetical protein